MAIKDYPEGLRPFIFHGLNVDYQPGGDQGVADCISCGKPAHLYINAGTGAWNCHRCSDSGNIYTFFRMLHKESMEAYANGKEETTAELLSAAKGISIDTLWEWGIVPSVLTGDLIIPSYNMDNRLATLYRVFLEGDKWKPLVAPTTKRHPFGWNLIGDQKTLFICEGPWDAMALYEAFQENYRQPDGTIEPCNQRRNLLHEYAVIGLPGVSHWHDEMFSSLPENVVFAFDNDHPERRGKKIVQPAWDGIQRIVKMAAKVETPPNLAALAWGKDYHDEEISSGYDISDLLTEQGSIAGLQFLFNRIRKLKIPSKPVRSPKKKQAEEVPELQPLPRTTFKELCVDYENCLHFPDRLRHALAVMLSTVVSVSLEGIQIWLRIIGPPGSGKSTLAEALSADRENIFPISHFTGLHSGYLEPGASPEDEDNSLIVKMHKKATIVKDGDTLLSNPQRNSILSEFRDVFDGTSRAHYRNKVTHEYEDIRTSLIVCGTDELRTLNRSSLGERFLDCDILGEHTGESYVDRAIQNTYRQVARGFLTEEVPEGEEPTESVDMETLKRATMGYIHSLKENLPKTAIPKISVANSKRLKALSSLVSLARTRVRRTKDDPTFRPRAELPTRLSSQLKKLAICLAYVLNKKQVDKSVMTIIRNVALDTSEGYQMEIIHQLYENKTRGMGSGEMAENLRLSKTLISDYLDDMERIGIVQKRRLSNGHGRGRDIFQWKLSQKFSANYKQALGS